MSLPSVPVTKHRSASAVAQLTELGGHRIAEFSIRGGTHAGSIGPAEGATLARIGQSAIDLGLPIVGTIASSGADVSEGLPSLHAWGEVARVLANASGVVPIILCVVGPCVSGPALLLGLADVVIMTEGAFAYVSGPETVRSFTGEIVDNSTLGGAIFHGQRSGVAEMVVGTEAEAALAAAHVLDYLPSNHLETPAPVFCDDPVERKCDSAQSTVPTQSSLAYDVRIVIEDVLDKSSFLELRANHAANLVPGLGRLDGQSVGIIANQPDYRAGTIDIGASEKAARFVQWCDCFNLPLITFVDTPGFEPGRDLEWRGMIRHGAELVHAYAAASVPRLGVILRKSYGGAYIVMDSKGLGNDWCGAWPTAEIAVMGARGAVQILEGKTLRDISDQDERSAKSETLEVEYSEKFANPYVAAERGLIDSVIEPRETRSVLAKVLEQISSKREPSLFRRHTNTPL